MSAFRASLERQLGEPVILYQETFGEPWLGRDDAYSQLMFAMLKRKYADRGVDLIIPIGSYPLQYMSSRYREIAPDAQLLYALLGGGQPRPPGTTGIVWLFDVAPTVEIALLQNPDARRIVFVQGGSEVDRAMLAYFQPSLDASQRAHPEIRLEVAPAEPFAELSHSMATLPRDTVVVFLVYFGDSVGQTFTPERALGLLLPHTSRPVYAVAKTYLGKGVVGGSVAEFEPMGNRLADIAFTVLQGVPPDQIPEVRDTFQRPVFDWAVMKRWGIREDRVPPGSTILNREHTAWELYRWQIIGGVALILAETALVLLLLRLRSVHRRAEQQARQSEQAIRDLSGRLITAQEEERGRIARELHDDINQQLAVLAIDLQRTEGGLPEGSGPAHSQLQELWKKTNDIAADVQRISHELHSSRLEHLGLTSALRGLCQEFARQHKLGIDFHAGDIPSHLDPKVSLSLFRIAQECLRNVAKHSQAKNIRMELAGERNSVVLRVSDDGIGFDVGRNGRPGLGMVSMQERLRLVGGRLRVRSGGPAGTQVEAWAPALSRTGASGTQAVQPPHGSSTPQ